MGSESTRTAIASRFKEDPLLMSRKCQVDNCELCGLSSAHCLSCKNHLIGVDNTCNQKDLKQCSISNCGNCSLVASESLNSSLEEGQSTTFVKTGSPLCLKCNPGYSLGEDLTCLKSIEGCRIYDFKKKQCLQCLFGWYMNSRFECSDGRVFLFLHGRPL
jgi:hypothetical protein